MSTEAGAEGLAREEAGGSVNDCGQGRGLKRSGGGTLNPGLEGQARQGFSYLSCDVRVGLGSSSL